MYKEKTKQTNLEQTNELYNTEKKREKVKKKIQVYRIQSDDKISDDPDSIVNVLRGVGAPYYRG